MAVKLLMLAAVAAAVMISESSAGLMDNGMVNNMLPPGCEDAIKGVIAKAQKTFEYMKKEECGKLCANAPVKANTLWPHEQLVKDIINAFLDFLKNPEGESEALDIDKVCPQTFKRAEIWPIYENMKKTCVKGTGEFDAHPNLCTVTKKDFPKLQKCVEDEAMKIFSKKMMTMPMGCASDALEKYCNVKWIKPREDYFFNKLRHDYKLFKGHNPWQFKEEFFAGKCTGKLVPRG